MSRKKITFYNRNGKFRTGELRDLSHNAAQFTVLTGRRRIGKTLLVMKAYEDEAVLYFFVTRST